MKSRLHLASEIPGLAGYDAFGCCMLCLHPYGSQCEDCVCAKARDTSVQYAACRLTVSFDSDYSGEGDSSPIFSAVSGFLSPRHAKFKGYY